MKVRVNYRLLCLQADTLAPSDPIHMVGSGARLPDIEKVV